MSDIIDSEVPQPERVLTKRSGKVVNLPKRTKVFHASADGQSSGFFTHFGPDKPVAPEGQSIVSEDDYRESVRALVGDPKESDDKQDKPGKPDIEPPRDPKSDQDNNGVGPKKG